MKTSLFIVCQYLTPQKLLSRFAGFIAECTYPWFKNRLIHWFVKKYQVDMTIAAEPDCTQYAHFNDFFTRSLAQGVRPIDEDSNSIVCPADGCISQIGPIQYGRIFQAKGQEYSLLELLGGNRSHASAFQDGIFATVYLSPKDYHRVHMPLAGKLDAMIHVPGDLFSVNDTTACHVPRLFSRNERVVCLFSTDNGPMAVILVGAMIVASIETVWAGLVAPAQRKIQSWSYGSNEKVLELAKGDELGRFKLGSTAIVLLGKDSAEWDSKLGAQSKVSMGQRLGQFIR